MTQPGQLTQNQPKGYLIPCEVMFSSKGSRTGGQAFYLYLSLPWAGHSGMHLILSGPCGAVLLCFGWDEGFDVGCCPGQGQGGFRMGYGWKSTCCFGEGWAIASDLSCGEIVSLALYVVSLLLFFCLLLSDSPPHPIRGLEEGWAVAGGFSCWLGQGWG